MSQLQSIAMRHTLHGVSEERLLSVVWCFLRNDLSLWTCFDIIAAQRTQVHKTAADWHSLADKRLSRMLHELL